MHRGARPIGIYRLMCKDQKALTLRPKLTSRVISRMLILCVASSSSNNNYVHRENYDLIRLNRTNSHGHQHIFVRINPVMRHALFRNSRRLYRHKYYLGFHLQIIVKCRDDPFMVGRRIGTYTQRLTSTNQRAAGHRLIVCCSQKNKHKPLSPCAK